MTAVVLTREERSKIVAEQTNQIQRIGERFYQVASRIRSDWRQVRARVAVLGVIPVTDADTSQVSSLMQEFLAETRGGLARLQLLGLFRC
jgi:hypothetical protein